MGWHDLTCLPDEGVVVDTISVSGMEQRLKRIGCLWFIPDGSMYVYYNIQFWRHVQEPCPEPTRKPGPGEKD